MDGADSGTLVNFPNDPSVPNHTPPIFEYDHNGGDAAIVGGYVYHGSAIDGLEGTYFFADFVTGKVMSFHYTGTGITDISPTGLRNCYRPPASQAPSPRSGDDSSCSCIW